MSLSKEEIKKRDAERHRAFRKKNKPHMAALRKARYIKNREKILARNAKYDATHKAERKAYDAQRGDYNRKKCRRYNSENRKTLREYNKRYVKTEAGRLSRLNSRHRRRALQKASPKPPTSKEMRTLRESAKECFYCRSSHARLTFDHFISLSQGGEHSLQNIVMACGSCNSRKKDRDPHEFIASLQSAKKPENFS